ncbi:hypothetical protein [Aeromonas dhakensis]|uniref:hypothetical protein n=1 Tax=Aeromonas dhakensis TaxID=196024 RepID=UPI0038D03CA3
MEYLTKFKIDDLSCANSEFIFILESLHKEELFERVPAAGESGHRMRKILFNKETPLGKLVEKNINATPKISILNCSRLPLQKSCYHYLELMPEYLGFLEIQEIKNENVQIGKNIIKEKLRIKIGLQALQSFWCRLLNNIKNSHTPKIIVCGLLAQCF